MAREDRMIARDVMTPNPVTVTPHARIAEVWDLMREHDIRHLPVVQGGELVGMVSDRDVAWLDMARLLMVEGADGLQRQLATLVVDVMSSDVLCVEPDTGLSDVIGLMLEHKIGAVPVVAPGLREVVGIVSYVDVLTAAQDLLDDEQAIP
jgi:acetoin utilization protein AcuB